MSIALRDSCRGREGTRERGEYLGGRARGGLFFHEYCPSLMPSVIVYCRNATQIIGGCATSPSCSKVGALCGGYPLVTGIGTVPACS